MRKRNQTHQIGLNRKGILNTTVYLDDDYYEKYKKIMGKGKMKLYAYPLVKWWFFKIYGYDFTNKETFYSELGDKNLSQFFRNLIDYIYVMKKKNSHWKKEIFETLKYNTDYENISTKFCNGKSILSVNHNNNWLYKIGDKLFYSQKEICEYYNISRSKLGMKVWRYGHEMSEDLFLNSSKHQFVNPKEDTHFFFENKEYFSLSQWVRDYNYTESSLSNVIGKVYSARKKLKGEYSDGEIVEIALKALLQNKILKMYEIVDGKEFFNKKDIFEYLSKKNNLEFYCIVGRHQRGWTYEEILRNKRFENNINKTEIVKLG